MAVSYNKLWKMLIDRKIKKMRLKAMTGISMGTLAKLGKDEIVSLEILTKVCHALECDIGDVVEVLPEQQDE